MRQQWSQDIYIRAWDFATLAHKGQVAVGPLRGIEYDYINHPGAVAMEIIWALDSNNSYNEYNEDLAIECAILHDIIEDTSYTYDDIYKLFGQEVADGVLALSKNRELPKADQIEDSLQRIILQPQEIWMVKLADRISNLTEPPFYWDSEKKRSYREDAKAIYTHLHSSNEALAKRLLHKIEVYQKYL